MSTVCPACGTENRDKARYCRGCARALVPPAELAADGQPDHKPDAKPAARTGRQSTRKARAAAAGGTGTAPSESGAHPPRRSEPLAWIGAVLLVGALLGWQFWPQAARTEVSGTAPAASASVSPPAAPQALMQTSVAQLAASEPVGATATATATPAASVKPQSPSTTSAAPETRPASAPKPRPKPARPSQVAVKERPAAESARPAPAPTPAPAPVAKVEPVPTPAPARVPGVDERCADRSNFLARDVCRIQACRNPALSGDPVCVRFREMEASNQDRLGN